MAATSVADYWTTRNALSRGCVEANPLAQGGSGALKLGITAAWLAPQALLAKSRRLRKVFSVVNIGVGTGWGAAAVHNARLRCR